MTSTKRAKAIYNERMKAEYWVHDFTKHKDALKKASLKLMQSYDGPEGMYHGHRVSDIVQCLVDGLDFRITKSSPSKLVVLLVALVNFQDFGDRERKPVLESRPSTDFRASA